jgi:hypothetical protein
MRLNHVLDPEALSSRLVEVKVHVTLGVNHHGLAFGTDQVGRLRQTGQVELLEVHGFMLPLPVLYGWSVSGGSSPIASFDPGL